MQTSDQICTSAAQIKCTTGDLADYLNIEFT